MVCIDKLGRELPAATVATAIFAGVSQEAAAEPSLHLLVACTTAVDVCFGYVPGNSIHTQWQL